jgi:hypothetical protein
MVRLVSSPGASEESAKEITAKPVETDFWRQQNAKIE